MNLESLDSKDRTLLNALQQNGKLTNQELAEMVNLSPSATARRVQLLEQAGIIKRYRAVLDHEFFEKTMQAFVFITLDSQDHPHLEAFEKAIKNLPNVQDCFLLAGQSDYLVRVVCKDLKAFEQIHAHELTQLPHVNRVQTTFALRQVIRNRGILV
jgi:DNA-binding Lrp family transcriptional regulator